MNASLWVKRFKDGRESVEDDPRQRASVTSRTDANVDYLRTLITCDQGLSIRASNETNINTEIVRKILREDLNM